MTSFYRARYRFQSEIASPPGDVHESLCVIHQALIETQGNEYAKIYWPMNLTEGPVITLEFWRPEFSYVKGKSLGVVILIYHRIKIDTPRLIEQRSSCRYEWLH